MDPTDLAPDDPRIAHVAAREERRRRTLIGLVGACIAVLVVVIFVTSLVDSDGETAHVLPDARLTTMEGATFDLIELRGQPTVINFFASWCPPCRAEMPDFELVHAARGDEVRFVGINTNETDVDAARALVDSTGVTYEILLGGGDDLMEELESTSLPMTLFVDADGVIVEKYIGVLQTSSLEERIDKLVSS